MKCILMNKNTEVLVAEYNDSLAVFSEIYEIKNIDYAPIIIKDLYLKGQDITPDLSKWFRGRGIPSWRDKLDILLARLNIKAPEVLLNKSFGLSLSDQYWIKQIDSNVSYDDINFFDHDFDSADFLEASFSNSNKTVIDESSLKTPNNTTDGMLKKSWIIENGQRYLLKGGYKNETLQPFNEALASEICKRLGFSHVEYTLDTYKNIVVSKCPCFITKDTEFVSAYQVMNNKKRHNNYYDYEEYIKILEEHQIKNAREKLENMYILDFLIMNDDRHLNNFGVIRDVNTLKWLDVAPIFDNGQSLNIIDYNDEEIITPGEGRLFYNVDYFDNIIKIVKNINRIDITKLNGLVEWFDDLLHKYQYITNMSDRRIQRLCILLNRQINKLKKLISENN